MTSPPFFFIPWLCAVSLIEMRYYTIRSGEILNFSYFTAMTSWWRHCSNTLIVAVGELHGFWLSQRCHVPQRSFQEYNSSDDSENEYKQLNYILTNRHVLFAIVKKYFYQNTLAGHYNTIILMIWHENC